MVGHQALSFPSERGGLSDGHARPLGHSGGPNTPPAIRQGLAASLFTAGLLLLLLASDVFGL
jgi:hypothetical protein